MESRGATATPGPSCTHNRDPQVCPLPSLLRKEVTWPVKKRHLKQKLRQHVLIAEQKWSLFLSHPFCSSGNSRSSRSHVRSAVFPKYSRSNANPISLPKGVSTACQRGCPRLLIGRGFFASACHESYASRDGWSRRLRPGSLRLKRELLSGMPGFSLIRRLCTEVDPIHLSCSTSRSRFKLTRRRPSSVRIGNTISIANLLKTTARSASKRHSKQRSFI